MGVLGIVLLFSCTKTYTCHCLLTHTSAPGLPDTTYNEFNITDTKGNAQNLCRQKSGVFYNNWIYTIDSCYLY